MNKVVAALVFVVVSAGMYFVCANAHIDIFPCEKAERPINAPASFGSKPQLQKRDGTCSLLAHNRGTGPDGEYEKLNVAGWGMLFAFCAGIGAVAGGLAGFLTRKKKS